MRCSQNTSKQSSQTVPSKEFRRSVDVLASRLAMLHKWDKLPVFFDQEN
jgi:hypothetical protein